MWLAVAAATITATVAIADYVSGAKQAREALKGMQETAEKWKSTAAETFYGQSEGLSFFGVSKSDFTRDRQNAQDWLNGLIAVWTDGKKESNEIVSEWTDSFKALTDSTRTELMQLKETADEAGYTSVSSGLSDDIATLDAMDAEITRLLKKRQNGYFSEKDKIRLQELIDTREAIEVKYHLSPTDADGFDTIRQKLDAEVARAQARGKPDADVTVYENAVVAAAQGLAAINSEIDAQYDKEYALIQLIEDSAERQAAMDALNARYNENRRAAAQEYAALLADIVMPVWEQESIQQAAADVDMLTQKLREYSAANETEKPALLEDLNAITAAMDEGAMTEYIAILTQIQSLGMVPQTTMDLIGSAVSRINSYTKSLDYSGWERFWASMRGESVDQGVLNQSMLNDFSPERVAELSTYVGEIVSAVLQGKQVSEDDVQNLQEILTFLQGLDTTDTGTHILEGVAEGMTAAGWDSDAETVASNLEAALNTALQIHSPSERVKPVGENVSAGVGLGMSGYDFASDMEAVAAAIDTAMTSALPQDALSSFGTSAAQGLSDAMSSFSMSSTGSNVAASVRTAVNTSLSGSTLRSAGLNAMAGLRAGILAGQSGVISAMRSAARSAVNAAKSELKIHSPSRVFEDEVGVMTMRGLGKGVLKESKAQAKIIRNASRYLTGEAREGTIVAGNTTNTHTYHQDSSVNFTGSTFYIRDEKDVQALAVEIAALTRRRQHGRGLRMA